MQTGRGFVEDVQRFAPLRALQFGGQLDALSLAAGKLRGRLSQPDISQADLPEDAKKAREFGAEGIGLCRTEHMFLGDRLPLVQRFILADTEKEEQAALEELETLQRSDFLGILEAMDGLPVTVRLLDPPLHEFLPDVEELLVRDAKGQLDDAGRKLLAAAQAWRESNPMLGTRGCRLGIIKPGLYRMQVRALMQADEAVIDNVLPMAKQRARKYKAA